ncbi:MAG: extracellular solute-binding protein, partial [Alphaproteobacteria bacterium]
MKKMELSKFKDMLAGGQLNRRQINQVLATIGIATVTVPVAGNWAQAASNLQLFTWAVYDSPELHPAYIEKYGASPSASFFADNDEAVLKLQAGYPSDVTVPTSFMISRYRDAGLLTPIDTSRIDAFGDIFSELSSIKGMVVDGKQWGLPWSWGNSSIIFRPDLAPEYSGAANNSWEIMWDPKYSGRIAQRDSMDAAVLQAALLIGIDDVYTMNDDEIEQVRAKLQEQRGLLRYYWSSDSDMEQSFAGGELIAAYSWNSSYSRMLKQGINVEWMNPKEGIFTWCDTQVLLKSGSASDDERYDYLHATLTPEAGKFMIEEFGFGSANEKAFDIADKMLMNEFGYSDPAALISGSLLFETWDP